MQVGALDERLAPVQDARGGVGGLAQAHVAHVQALQGPFLGESAWQQRDAE